jgi:hypothetical protein
VGSGYNLIDKLYLDDNYITFHSGLEFDLENEMRRIVYSIYTSDPINCHFWEYKNEYLLPNSVNIEELKQNPELHMPVANLFELCNRANIKYEFENALNEDGDYLNLLEQVSEEVTNTFRNIWRDLINVSIQLAQTGDYILIKIIDNVKFNCEDRSEGFKKFISILLMLSTKARANMLTDKDLILIDEPDQSLYPTSARFLRDELLEISKKANVIYTTHSQYMIDTSCIERHMIVEKKNDFTIINTSFNGSSYTEDEILLNAIGTSIFESLRPVNIIFEGYLDYLFFKKYLQYFDIEKEFKKYGTVYLAGISGVDNLVAILMLANKKFIIVSDSDSISTSKYKQFTSNYPEYSSNWLKYGEVDGSFNTIEDFLIPEYVESKFLTIDNTFTYNKSLNVIQNIDELFKNNKEEKRKIKNELLENMSLDDMKTDYSKFIELIKGRIKSIS